MQAFVHYVLLYTKAWNKNFNVQFTAQPSRHEKTHFHPAVVIKNNLKFSSNACLLIAMFAAAVKPISLLFILPALRNNTYTWNFFANIQLVIDQLPFCITRRLITFVSQLTSFLIDFDNSYSARTPMHFPPASAPDYVRLPRKTWLPRG